jgi:4,5-dihydroxyphthalate decarboxylase
VKLELQNEDVETLLLNGELDAVILPNIAQSFRAGDPRIHRVFADCRASIRNYFQSTGIFPITHTLVTHERKISQFPWLCQELVTAFNEADRQCRMEYEYPKRFSFPTAVLLLEEEEQQFGKNPWTHGLEPNRFVLKKFSRPRAGYIIRPAVDDCSRWSEGTGCSRFGSTPAVSLLNGFKV